jgi:hypothetical protein
MVTHYEVKLKKIVYQAKQGTLWEMQLSLLVINSSSITIKFEVTELQVMRPSLNKPHAKT